MTLTKKAVKTAAHILFFSLLSVFFACGELSTSLFSSGGTYQVKALVNDSSLESCSIIRRNDKIIPYFAVSVVNDPDLTGLLVYIKNSKGDIIGERILYTIESVDEEVQPETTQKEKDLEDNDSGDKDLEDNDTAASFGETEEGETAGQGEQESPKQVTEKQNSADTRSAVKKPDTVVIVKSFQQEMPYFQLPKNTEVGQYSLVFEVVGRTNTLSFTELDIFYLGNVEFRLNDISMYLPWFSDTHLVPPNAAVMLEASLDFDSRLNPYVIWYNGRNIISEGNISEGAGTVLWKAPEQPGFYSLRLEVFPYRLKRNFTGIFREITIPVSAKASQTGYFFEIEPDYPAKKSLSAGTAYAEQVKLAAAQTAAVAENGNKTAAAPEYPELLRWYRFDGSLDEVRPAPERMFESAVKKAPRWAAVEQSYGLSVGSDDTYLLRPINFFRRGQSQGGGIFLFHIRPIAEGTIFNAFFPSLASANALASVSDGVWMDMAMRKNTVTLRLKTKGISVEIPVNTDYSGKQGFIPIVVEFYIRPNRLEAKLSVGEDIFMQSMTTGIRLPGVLAGEGRIKLGVDKTAPGNTVEVKRVLASNLSASETSSETDGGADENPAVETVQSTVTTIWDEFAILYSASPLLPEGFFIEGHDSDSGKIEDAQGKEEARLRQASASRLAESADTGALLENEAANIRIEQVPAEAEDEEAQSLISIS
jgi:hypothetical protein